MTRPSAASGDQGTRPAATEEWRFPGRATPPGSSAYYTVRFSPAPLRDTLAALLGWRERLRAILDDVSDPGVARLKLDWWRDEIRRAAEGAPRHPLGHLLTPALAAHALPVEPFLTQAQRVEDELYRRHGTDLSQHMQALAADRGALFELICRVHGEHAPGLLAAARNAGAWCEQVRRIRDAGLLLRRGRDVLPLDRLEAAGLTPEGLASRRQRHRLPELLRPLAEDLRAASPDPDPAGALPRALRIQLRIHRTLLDELAASGFDVTDQRIGLTPLRKLWLAWRTPARA
jgi:phytoene synthase